MRKFLLGFLVSIFSMGLLTAPAMAAIDNTPDHDSVAIIKGGVYSEAALQTKARQGDVPKVFAAFGIQQSELTGFVSGVVWKDGRVTVGTDKVVARSAVTAGRWGTPKAGMTRIAGTNNAYKMSTSHFVDEGQTAFIKMVNGKFSFAIIKPCGNPVTASPVNTDKPNLSVSKQVSTWNSNSWKESVTVQRGQQVKFRIIAKNTGNTTLDKLSIQDVLPRGFLQVFNGASTLNGTAFSNSLADGMTLPTLKPGQSHTIIFGAGTTQVNVTDATCSTGLVNRGIIRSGDVVPDKSDTAVVKVCALKEASAYACGSLRHEIVSTSYRQVRFSSAHAVSGSARFVQYEYDFGDGSQRRSTANNLVEHTYAKDGSYTARVSAIFTVNGSQKKVTSEACVVTISFTTPPAPVQSVTPVKSVPEKLVDTGPGALVGAVLSAFTGGMAAYKLVWLHRIVL